MTPGGKQTYPSAYSSLLSWWIEVASRPPTSAHSSLYSFLPYCVFPQHMTPSVSSSLPIPHYILPFGNKAHMPGIARCQAGPWLSSYQLGPGQPKVPSYLSTGWSLGVPGQLTTIWAVKHQVGVAYTIFISFCWLGILFCLYLFIIFYSAKFITCQYFI